MSGWMPGNRDGQTAMAENRLTEIPIRGTGWGIPAGDVTELTALLAVAKTALAKTKSAERSAVDTAECKTAFEALKAKMRYIKERYIHKPPLTEGDYAALGLEVPDRIPTTVPPPSGFAEADVSYPLGRRIYGEVYGPKVRIRRGYAKQVLPRPRVTLI